ncbi:hypothetical protein pEaSNUABM22_00294 [Erwinia phage pEa_SNUABM_22]|uniref:UV damage repair endonuclease n=1 Tax=Erwinia phage pEa_SNUABM_22 TaxID=2869549 RepID=A0AAE8XQX2_9CAUD|nr:endonuclease [Erwinia phage pEa_SNUABM_22]UAW96781.1 hypothetical protein pEaSNUABM22_00294 [Erwinia phage pEa_SNUABM_22]
MRFGFACKLLDANNKQPFTNKSLSYKHFSALSAADQHTKLLEVVTHNLTSLLDMIKHVGRLRTDLRMFRITSELLPLYTHPKVFHMYMRHDVVTITESLLALCGEAARRHDVRLSFHPGQFTVLASDRPDVVQNSIAELEYHAYCAYHMGYGRRFQDFKINIHLSGRLGASGFRQAHSKLSDRCRNMLTVENDEITSSLEDCLALADICPIVLDIHHHWVMTNEYIQPTDDRVQRVIDSWRGVRPAAHYSVSKPEFVPSRGLPDQNKLSANRMQLRAHADYYHNEDVNEWATSFTDFDLMCESKAKNRARLKLACFSVNSANNWTK